MYFLVTHLDSILVPVGVVLFFLTWIAIMGYAFWTVKKKIATGEWHWTFSTTNTNDIFSQDPHRFDPSYRNYPGNIYYEDD